MSIKFALLGLLSEGPHSGYDLKKRIASSPVFYWSGNNNQIYRTLIQLNADGLASQQVQPQDNAPAKKVYTITPLGQTELDLWLRSTPELPELHNPFLIQLAWAGRLPEADLDALLVHYEDEVAARLILLGEQARREKRPDESSPRAVFLWQRIHHNLRDHYQAELDWVRRLRADIQSAGLPNKTRERLP